MTRGEIQLPPYIYQPDVFVMLLNSQVIKVGLCAITSRHTIRGKLVSVQLLTGRIVFSLLVYRSQFILGNLSLTTIERFNSNWLHNVASKVLNFNGDILCSHVFYTCTWELWDYRNIRSKLPRFLLKNIILVRYTREYTALIK